MKPIVRQGDTLLEYGGQVLEGKYQCHGLPMAFLGASVRCAQHGMTQVAEGSALMQVDGYPVALHGQRCACGCTLVSSLPDSQVQS